MTKHSCPILFGCFGRLWSEDMSWCLSTKFSWFTYRMLVVSNNFKYLMAAVCSITDDDSVITECKNTLNKFICKIPPKHKAKNKTLWKDINWFNHILFGLHLTYIFISDFKNSFFLIRGSHFKYIDINISVIQFLWLYQRLF